MENITQLSLDLPNYYTSSEGYKKALEHYERDIKLKDLYPVFLVYCGSTKTFSCFRLASKTLIESFKSNRIIK